MTAETSLLVPPGDGLDPAKMPGHWLLARMGKRVLRPGGRELSRLLLAALDITSDDDVVELAPGFGETTRRVLDRRPHSYTGIERDEHAAAIVRALLTRDQYRCQVGTALNTGLGDGVATVVFGEAFLSMQSDDHKQKIADEAFRILRPGGRYGLHELSIRPDDVSDDIREEINGELSRSIHVGARPLTSTAWRTMLQRAGFELAYEYTAPMALLQPRRLIADEGPRRAATFAVKVLSSGDARRRVRSMRAMFRRRADNLAAVALVARKPAG